VVLKIEPAREGCSQEDPQIKPEEKSILTNIQIATKKRKKYEKARQHDSFKCLSLFNK
jgi:hypothetical protein